MQTIIYLNYSGQEIPSIFLAFFNLIKTTQLKLNEKNRYSMVFVFIDSETNLKNTLFELRKINDIGKVFILLLDKCHTDSQYYNEILNTGADGIISCESPEIALAQIQAYISRWIEINQVLNNTFIQSNLVGNSKVWRKLLEQVIEVGLYSNSSVLLLGESGTGKEMLAQLIHKTDKLKKNNEFVILDCTTIAPELWGSELFGHEKGAFTGAVSSREGAFHLANNGTLFLDEIGELPSHLQAALLRVLQEGSYKKLGSNNYRHTEFRLVSATNKNMEEAIIRGQFRSDLYHRMATWVFQVPPLRERREDIPLLVDHFIKVLHPINPPQCDDMVYDFLVKREYPGNIRELKHLVEQLLTKYIGNGMLTYAQIPEKERCLYKPENWVTPLFTNSLENALYIGKNLKEIKEETADTAVEVALQISKGKVKQAAKRLGITERAIQLRAAKKNKSDAHSPSL